LSTTHFDTYATLLEPTSPLQSQFCHWS